MRGQLILTGHEMYDYIYLYYMYIYTHTHDIYDINGYTFTSILVDKYRIRALIAYHNILDHKNGLKNTDKEKIKKG